MAKNIVNLTIDGGSYTARPYGTCSTAAGTAAKAVTCADFELVSGTTIIVKFDAANTASTPTLNVNSKGAKNIFHKGAQITSGGNKALLAGTVEFLYDGTQWQLLGNYIDTDSNTDTKNTAGSTDTSSLIYLIGATSQAANPQTYSHNTAYVGTDGCLYSNSTKVSVEGHTQSYTTLTGSSTTANQAIVSSGTANGWTLKTLGSNAFNSTTIPTNTNQLTNGAGFITSSGSITGSSGSCTGNAATATALTTTSKGSATQPIYWDVNGKPAACTYTLGTSVPSNAVFTDTNTWRPLGTTSDTACAGNDSRLSNSRPASDVYSWAKQSSKPSYSFNEISCGVGTATTLASLDVTKQVIHATLSAATSISLSAALEVGKSITVICTPSATFTQPIPTSGSYISMDGDSLEVTKDKPFEINILCYASGKYSISCKNSK